MRLALAATLVLALAPAVSAQTAAPGAGKPPPASMSMSAPAAKPKREPTVGQMAARERQKKCGVEWKAAKAAGKTAGQKWPQFWSACNARLKGNSA